MPTTRVIEYRRDFEAKRPRKPSMWVHLPSSSYGDPAPVLLLWMRARVASRRVVSRMAWWWAVVVSPASAADLVAYSAR